MSWEDAFIRSYWIGNLVLAAYFSAAAARDIWRDIKSTYAHRLQLAYIAGWNAAHEQIRQQLMDAGMVVQMNDDVSETHTVH